MKIHAIKLVKCPVWVDDVMTDEKEPRVLVVFRNVKSLNGLEVGAAQIGSLFLHRDVTLEQAEAALPTDADYSKQVKFVAKDDSDFFKAVLI